MLFFIISPLILAYTAGYRYDFATGTIEQTGVISIDVEPRDARVLINDTVVDSRIPIRLPNRAPGTYHLTIEAPGKHTWERDITVRSRQTTYVRNVTLFDTAVPTQLLQDPSDRIQSVQFAADGTYALLVIKEREHAYIVQLLDTLAGTVATLTDKPFSQEPTVQWSPYAPQAVVTVQADQTQSIYRVSLESKQLIQPPLLTQTDTPLQWNEEDASLFVQTDDGIVELTDTDIRILQQHASSSIWHIDANRTLWWYDESQKIITDGSVQYPARDLITSIVSVNDKRIIGQSDNRIVIVPRDESIDYSSTIMADAIWHAAALDEWLAWTPWELTALYPTGHTEVLNRTSNPMHSVIPLDEFGVLLLASETDLLGFNPGYYVTHTLLRNQTIHAVGVSKKDRQIFFHGTVGSTAGIFSLSY